MISNAINEPGSLQDEVAKLRKAAEPGPLFDVAELRPRDVIPADLMHEAGIRVLHDAILRWRVRCRQLELQVERLEQELAAAVEERRKILAEAIGVIDEKQKLQAYIDEQGARMLRLERELAAATEEAARLRAAAELAGRAIEWGMGDGH